MNKNPENLIEFITQPFFSFFIMLVVYCIAWFLLSKKEPEVKAVWLKLFDGAWVFAALFGIYGATMQVSSMWNAQKAELLKEQELISYGFLQRNIWSLNELVICRQFIKSDATPEDFDVNARNKLHNNACAKFTPFAKATLKRPLGEFDSSKLVSQLNTIVSILENDDVIESNVNDLMIMMNDLNEITAKRNKAIKNSLESDSDKGVKVSVLIFLILIAPLRFFKSVDEFFEARNKCNTKNAQLSETLTNLEPANIDHGQPANTNKEN